MKMNSALKCNGKGRGMTESLRFFFLTLLVFINPCEVFSQAFYLQVGEEQDLIVPEVSVGYVDHTVWACDKANVTFLEKDNTRAKIKVTSYFDDYATVSLVYVSKYIDSKGFTRSYTGTKYYTIQCKGTAPTIVPSGITLKVGETYQLHISPSSYESNVVWSDDWNLPVARVNDNGLVTARKVGTNIIFATVSGLSDPLTCWVNVVNPKLTLSADLKSGTIDKGSKVSLTASKTNATIYYTLDGTSPEQNGDIYTGPITINSDATLKAIAYDKDEEKEPSDILERQYAVKNNSSEDLDNVIYIEPTKAFAGDQTTLSIKMKNSATIRSFQFNLYLPSGVTVATNSKGKIQASLNTERLNEDDEHILSAIEQNDGSILFLCDSQYEENFTGNDGEVATVTLNVSESLKAGDVPITLKNIKLIENNNSNYYETSNFSTNLTVLHYILGDVNGDQKVDVSDYIGIANHIHGNISDVFIEKVADVDNSGNVDISDYIGVANLAHTGSIYGDVLKATIKTNEATSVEDNYATLNGTLTLVSATKDYTVGFFVSENGTPSNENNIKAIVNGSNKKGVFSSTVTDLAYSTTYYYCAYILYDGVYYYGETQTFTTTKKTTYAIGDLYPSDDPIGVVFSISNGGKSGKIFSLETIYTDWYSAKAWASRYKDNSGWYLPSRSELQQIARNISLFQSRNLISAWSYWSSDKDVMSSGAIYEYAYIVNLSGGSSYSRVTEQSHQVVAVHSF